MKWRWSNVGYPQLSFQFLRRALVIAPLLRPARKPGRLLIHLHIMRNTAKLEKILKENIASFWYTKSLDHNNGGYIINFGPKGEYKGPGTKMIVTQARTLWLFSRMARAGYAGEEYLAAADIGFHFLKENGQAFALYAISEYYRASKLPLARERLLELINIQSNAMVRKNLGACTDKYERDWTPRPEAGYARVSYGRDIENVWLLIDACDAAGLSNYPSEKVAKLAVLHSYVHPGNH